ncbi:MAG: hypothetical protein C0503_02410 [Gemmatimonas sp.]|nr:hypothetical protein [Gemmatimonas sp.]
MRSTSMASVSMLCCSCANCCATAGPCTSDLSCQRSIIRMMPRTMGVRITIIAMLPNTMPTIGTTSGGMSGLTCTMEGGWTAVPTTA